MSRAEPPRSFDAWLAATGHRIESALLRILPREDGPAPLLAQAMRYAVTAGGKRIRPLLVHAAGDLGSADPSLLDACASAVELIHTYSLIHDDLPCMDDDDLRRGRPTSHRVFGEAQAMLAGDALQALAFEVLVDGCDQARAAGRDAGAADAWAADGLPGALLGLLARASGATGMAGGQSIDLASVGKALGRSELELMHRMKTGALFSASVLLGAASAGLSGGSGREAVETYAARIGLAFQVVDDVLDVVSDSHTLGKTPGKDAANDKPTFVSLLGLAGARELAARLHDEAVQALLPLGGRAQRLADLAGLIVNRAS